MRRKPPNEPSPGNWMNTYGDLVTLLLCFFVLLFSFSTIDAAKWEALVKSFSGASGIIEQNRPADYQPLPHNPIRRDEHEWLLPRHPEPDPPEAAPVTLPPQPSPTEAAAEPSPTEQAPTPTVTPEPERETTATRTTTSAPAATSRPAATPTPVPTPTPAPRLDEFYSELRSYFKNSALDPGISLEYRDDTIIIRLIASVIFEPGSDRLVPQAQTVLQGATEIINQFESQISQMHTEGHTDDKNDPEADIQSKWELAARRSAHVLDFLMQQCSLDPGQVFTVGYGSSRPIASNETKEGRDQNNRVDVVLTG